MMLTDFSLNVAAGLVVVLVAWLAGSALRLARATQRLTLTVDGLAARIDALEREIPCHPSPPRTGRRG